MTCCDPRQSMRLQFTCSCAGMLSVFLFGCTALPSTQELQITQGYIEPAPIGIDARYSWDFPGGAGVNVTIFDLEYSWGNGIDPQTGKTSIAYSGPANHPELTGAGTDALLLPDGVQFGCSELTAGAARHGAQVVGIMVANSDPVRSDDLPQLTGISYQAGVALVPVCKELPADDADVAEAIDRALIRAEPGDVILLEVSNQNACEKPGFGAEGPIEEKLLVFQAIQRAVMAGVVVVEPAGNGSINLDNPECASRFDQRLWYSGAIVVAGGCPPGGCIIPCSFDEEPNPDGARNCNSSFGHRVDLQAWGDGVFTSSYRTTPSREPNYSGAFGGTSAAGPIVAGAVANIQSIAIAQWGRSLSMSYIRELLKTTAYEPSEYRPDERIGRRPDLRAAISKLASDISLPGDMDGNFVRNAEDINAIVLCYLQDMPAPTPDCTQKCDVNHNGACDIEDLNLVIRVIAGQIEPNRLPVENPYFYSPGQCRIVRNLLLCAVPAPVPPKNLRINHARDLKGR